MAAGEVIADGCQHEPREREHAKATGQGFSQRHGEAGRGGIGTGGGKLRPFCSIWSNWNYCKMATWLGLRCLLIQKLMEPTIQTILSVAGILGGLATMLNLFVALSQSTQEARNRMLSWAKTGIGHAFFIGLFAGYAWIAHGMASEAAPTEGKWFVLNSLVLIITVLLAIFVPWILWIWPSQKALAEERDNEMFETQRRLDRAIREIKRLSEQCAHLEAVLASDEEHEGQRMPKQPTNVVRAIERGRADQDVVDMQQ